MYVRCSGRVLFVYVLNNGMLAWTVIVLSSREVLCVIYYLPSIICSYVFERNIANPSLAFTVYCLSNPAPIPEYICRPYNRVIGQV
jgi:hypothetical protein